MKSQEVYDAWKERKHQIDIQGNFADEVMNQVYQYEHAKRKPLFDIQRFVEFISGHPLAKAGVIAAGAVTGFVRIVFIVCTFLRT